MIFLRTFAERAQTPIRPVNENSDLVGDLPWDFTIDEFNEYQRLRWEDYEGDYEPEDPIDLDWTCQKKLPESARKFQFLTDLPMSYDGLNYGPDCLLRHKESQDLYLLRFDLLFAQWGENESVRKFLGPYLWNSEFGFAPPGNEVKSDFWQQSSEVLATDLSQQPSSSNLFGAAPTGVGVTGYLQSGPGAAHLVLVDASLARQIVESLEEDEDPRSPALARNQSAFKAGFYLDKPYTALTLNVKAATPEGRETYKILYRQFRRQI